MSDYKIKKLQVSNFRNLENDIFEFVPGINCIFGKNGNGKTNLLEALHYLTNKKSFRKNVSFPQIINIDGEKPEFLIQAVLEKNKELISYSLRSNLTLEERFKNGAPDKQKCLLLSIFINPFDSYNFHQATSFRRNWLDQSISILNSEYKKTLSKFNKALKFRNALLTMHSNIYDQINAIDEQIAECSHKLTKLRIQFCSDLNQFITQSYKEIFSSKIELNLELQSQFIGWDEIRILNFYKDQQKVDYNAGVTRYGIHRDDIIFYFNGLNAFEFCSLGQQKMAFLSLIFAYIELFRYKFESYPLVLIDDVSGELDSQRWKNLIQYLEQKNFQVVITTANENFGIELGQIPNSKKFYINHGKLSHNHG